MAKLLFKHSESAYGKFRVFIQDATSAVGAGLTGLTFSTSGLSIHTIADNEATVTSYTAAGSTIETITTIGTFAAPTATKCRFKEIDSTNLPGWYEIQIADARWAVSGARAVQVCIAVTGGFCAPVEIQLALFDVNDTVRGGMTALPNAAAEASGGLPTLSAAQASNGTINANVHRWLTGTPNALQSGRVDGYIGAVATGVIAAASFAANALDAVWSATTRTLSAAGVQAIWDAATSALTTVGSIGKWIVDKIDVVLSTRLASASYTAPLDAAGTRTAVGLAFPDLDTKFTDLNTDVQQLDLQVDNVYADTQGILGRIGAFTGSGVNTVLGFFKALLSKTATTPSDVGGTFDPATDSTEAIRDRGDAAWVTGSAAPTALAVADAVWDELLSGHVVAGSTGEALTDAAAGGGGGGGGGSTAAEIWSYPTRVLTGGGGGGGGGTSICLNGSWLKQMATMKLTMSKKSTNTLEFSIPGLPSQTTVVSAIFHIKTKLSDVDVDALVTKTITTVLASDGGVLNNGGSSDHTAKLRIIIDTNDLDALSYLRTYVFAIKCILNNGTVYSNERMTGIVKIKAAGVEAIT